MKSEKLTRGWSFTENGVTREITIPHDYMIGADRCPDSPTAADGGFFTPGRASYEYKFTASECTHHFIRFDGVMGLCEVFVNGNLVKRHSYGYTAFLCDADDFILPGENTLRVNVDNTAQPSSRWYSGSGIYREVDLLTANQDYIAPYGIYAKTLSLHGDSAYLSVETTVCADRPKTAALCLKFEYQGACIFELIRHVWLERGENKIPIKTTLHGIKTWAPDAPELYTVTASITTAQSTDSDSATFGIRTITCDPVRGFILNGEPIKLYGACVHHDNGIVGAASFRSSEERRVRILRENGFNAIRTSHNPPSTVLLDVCDRLGMLVIDEMFDAWRIGKKDFDYHIWFETYFSEDTTVTVLRDRNHPSVVMWSTGNEIPEKNGVSHGYRTGNAIAETIRSLDDTRPLTHALCTFWDNSDYDKKDNETHDYPADKLDFFSEKTMYIADILDVVGYNYLLFRLDKDFIRFPDRLVAMTESFPMDAVAAKKAMDEHIRFVGEFVWTGWDYFGETGIGHTKPGEGSTWGLTSYPEHTANCGDLDICGFKTPQSYYRDAAWFPGSVRIMTGDPAEYGAKYKISAWGFYRVNRTWNYDCAEGAPTTVHLYTTAEECELWQDGVSLGRKSPNEKGIAEFNVGYKPGKLEAAAYHDGKLTGRDVLETAGEPVGVKIIPDAAQQDVIYAEIALVDESNRQAVGSSAVITVTAEGASVLGTGNGDKSTVHKYPSNECETYRGHILAALLPDEGTTEVKIHVTSDLGYCDECVIKL